MQLYFNFHVSEDLIRQSVHQNPIASMNYVERFFRFLYTKRVFSDVNRSENKMIDVELCSSDQLFRYDKHYRVGF